MRRHTEIPQKVKTISRDAIARIKAMTRAMHEIERELGDEPITIGELVDRAAARVSAKAEPKVT
jgi:hypothetical protein